MDKYERVAKLGEGGQGKVYKVRSKTSGRELVCKMILCVDQETVELATKEAEVMGWLKHKNIIQYEGTFLHQGKAGLYLCLIMEYCSRGDLHTKMREYKHKKESFKEKQAIRYLKQVLTALEFMHKSGFCHRDIKAANILFDESGTVKVGDFGLSTLMSPMGQQTVVGTPFYFAPEIMLQRKYTTKVDIWNLGVVFLELCTLRQRPANVEVLHSEQSVLEDIHREVMRHGYSRPLATLITQTLRRRPQDRPSATDLLEQVAQIWGDQDPPVTPCAGPMAVGGQQVRNPTPQRQPTPTRQTPTAEGKAYRNAAQQQQQQQQAQQAQAHQQQTVRNQTPPRRAVTPTRGRAAEVQQQQQQHHHHHYGGQGQQQQQQQQQAAQGTGHTQQQQHQHQHQQQPQQQQPKHAAQPTPQQGSSSGSQQGTGGHPQKQCTTVVYQQPTTPRIQSPPNQSWTPPAISQGSANSRSNYTSSASNGLSSSGSGSSQPTYTQSHMPPATLASPRGPVGRPPVPTPQHGRSPSPAHGRFVEAPPSPRGPSASQQQQEEAFQGVVQKLLGLSFSDVRTKARLLACHSRPEVVTLCNSVSDDDLLSSALEQWLTLKVSV